MLRAGLTDRFVIWNSDQVHQGQPEADGEPSESLWRAGIGRSKNDHQEHECQQNFGQQTRPQSISRQENVVRIRWMLIQRSTKTRELAARYNIKRSGSGDRSRHLSDDISMDLRPRKPLRDR